MASYWFYHEWDNIEDKCRVCGRNRTDIGPAPDAQMRLPGTKWRIGSVQCRPIMERPGVEPVEDKPEDEPEPEKPKRKRFFK